jgi:uncharacterized membrane protein (DUF485 family)
MWWIAFTAVDLYICLIILEAMMPSLPAEKIGRAKVGRKIIVGSLAVLVIAFVVALVKRYTAHT